MLEERRKIKLSARGRTLTICAVAFFFNPLLGIVLLAFAFGYTSKDVRYYYALGLFIALYLALINMTKIPESDMLQYQAYYMLSGKCSLKKYLIEQNFKEPLYIVTTYVCYYLFHGSWDFYVVFITFFYYAIINYCIIRVGREYGVSHFCIITALFFSSFFFQAFSFVGHAMRQCTAEAIFALFLVEYFLNNKRKWWILICAVLYHSVILPLCILPFIPKIKKAMTFKRVLVMLVSISILSILYYSLEPYLANLPVIGYSYSRLNSGLLNENGRTMFKFTTPTIFYMIVYIMMLFYSTYTFYKKKMESGIVAISNILLLIVIFILVMQILQGYYLILRYFIVLYAFGGIVLVFFLSKLSVHVRFAVELVMIPFILVYFYYYLDDNTFTYESSYQALVNPVFAYFFM
jgi:hypothetical protein